MTATSDEGRLLVTSSLTRTIALAVVVGLTLSWLSLAGDTIGTPRSVTLLGNLAAPWALGALLVGLTVARPRRAAAAGAVALLLATAIYYAVGWRNGYPMGSAQLVWTAVALVAGPLAGWTGSTLATRVGDRSHQLAVGLTAAMLIGEPVRTLVERRVWLWSFSTEPHRWLDLGVLVALSVIGGALVLRHRGHLSGGRATVTAAVGVAVGAAGFLALETTLRLA